MQFEPWMLGDQAFTTACSPSQGRSALSPIGHRRVDEVLQRLPSLDCDDIDDLAEGDVAQDRQDIIDPSRRGTAVAWKPFR